MNYHNIKHCDGNNGSYGIGVTLFVAGCSHGCKGCHNPQTHDPNSGIPFDNKARQEILQELSNDWCNGLTLSGGDPLYPGNRKEILSLVQEVRTQFPNKSIWVYTGYLYDQSKDDPTVKPILDCCDVLVDGPFVESLKEYGLHWRGSKNQNVIDLRTGKVLEVD